MLKLLDKKIFIRILLIISFVIMCINMYLLNELELGAINFIEITIAISILLINILYAIIINKKIKEIKLVTIILSLIILLLPLIILITLNTNMTEWRYSRITDISQTTNAIELSPLGACNYRYSIDYFKDIYDSKDIELNAYRRNECSWKKDGDLYELKIIYNGEAKKITCSNEYDDGDEFLICQAFNGTNKIKLEKQ